VLHLLCADALAHEVRKHDHELVEVQRPGHVLVRVLEHRLRKGVSPHRRGGLDASLEEGRPPWEPEEGTEGVPLFLDSPSSSGCGLGATYGILITYL
jgi:hypothetical protein